MIETFKLLVLSAARYNIFEEWNTHVFSSTTLGFWLGRHQVECEFSRPCTVLLLLLFILPPLQESFPLLFRGQAEVRYSGTPQLRPIISCYVTKIVFFSMESAFISYVCSFI